MFDCWLAWTFETAVQVNSEMLRGKNGVIHVARVTRSAFLGIRVKRRKNNSACFFIILKSEEEWICKNRALTNELVRSESCLKSRRPLSCSCAFCSLRLLVENPHRHRRLCRRLWRFLEAVQSHWRPMRRFRLLWSCQKGMARHDFRFRCPVSMESRPALVTGDVADSPRELRMPFGNVTRYEYVCYTFV